MLLRYLRGVCAVIHNASSACVSSCQPGSLRPTVTAASSLLGLMRHGTAHHCLQAVLPYISTLVTDRPDFVTVADSRQLAQALVQATARLACELVHLSNGTASTTATADIEATFTSLSDTLQVCLRLTRSAILTHSAPAWRSESPQIPSPPCLVCAADSALQLPGRV